MIKRQITLRKYNTFGIDVAASEFAHVRSTQELQQVLNSGTREPFVLGGGSNMLLTKDLDRLVLHIEIPGIEVVRELRTEVLVKIGAGVIWHDLVLWAVEHGYGGIENLALIPGKVGAAPIQNIGAYGVEIKEVFDRLRAVHLESGDETIFTFEDCEFGYRDSVFKHKELGKYCISHVLLRLQKPPHSIHDSYGAIRDTLSEDNIDKPLIGDVCNAVIRIRSSKLPDPAVLGNSGSFFKNPVVPKSQWENLKSTFPNLVFYPDIEGHYKIPAGWLIDQAGWKGKRIGNVGCYEKQALVIVNYGGASGQEVYDHAMRVQASVNDKFGILLTPEVNIL